MEKTHKIYMMLGGTFLPATLAVAAAAILFKEPISFKSSKLLIAFAIGASIGGYYSSQILKEKA